MKRKLHFKEKLLLPFQQIRNWFLVKRFPFLKPSLGYGCDMHYHRNGYKYRYEETWLDCLPRGWRKKFGIQICKELKAVIERDKLSKYAVTQVKEKFGILCWYDEGGNKETNKIVIKYADMTSEICIYCGKPAEYVAKNWIQYYCPECIDKFNMKDKAQNIRLTKLINEANGWHTINKL